MDLTKTYPRSAKTKLGGLVSLARTIDKARAFNAGTLGEYDFDCPHDKPLFEFLEVDGPTFASHVKGLDSDQALVAWLQGESLGKKTPADIEKFNAERMRWHPEPGSPSYGYFTQVREQVAPGREEIVTWFDLLDLDEKRPVPIATSV